MEVAVATTARRAILRNAKIIVFTPDVIHAWLLSSLSERAVLNFLQNISLIVIDEVHNYTGVFGSNAGFLFRRIQHVMQLLGRQPQFLCASATIAEPNSHLAKLTGLPFELIGPESDTSPRHELTIQLMVPPAEVDF